MYKIMDERTATQVVEAIKDRREIPKAYMSIVSMLAINDISDYEFVCCNRLSKFIDDEHIKLDLFSNIGDNGIDIMLDDVGISACESVLKGYIPIEKLQGYQKYVFLENEAIKAYNTQIKNIRNVSTVIIKEMLRELEEHIIDVEAASDLRIMLEAELEARKPLKKAFKNIRGIYDDAAFKIVNYDRIKAIKRGVAKYTKETVAKNENKY